MVEGGSLPMTDAFLCRTRDNSSSILNCTPCLSVSLPSTCNGETHNNLSHSETRAFSKPLHPSLSWPRRRTAPLFNDTPREEVVSLCSSAMTVSISVCSNALTKLTWPHFLVNLMDFFLHFFFPCWSLPTRLYVTSSSATEFRSHVKFNVSRFWRCLD